MKGRNFLTSVPLVGLSIGMSSAAVGGKTTVMAQRPATRKRGIVLSVAVCCVVWRDLRRRRQESITTLYCAKEIVL